MRRDRPQAPGFAGAAWAFPFMFWFVGQVRIKLSSKQWPVSIGAAMRAWHEDACHLASGNGREYDRQSRGDDTDGAGTYDRRPFAPLGATRAEQDGLDLRRSGLDLLRNGRDL